MALFVDENHLLDSLNDAHCGRPPGLSPYLDQLVAWNYATNNPIALTASGLKRQADLAKKNVARP